MFFRNLQVTRDSGNVQSATKSLTLPRSIITGAEPLNRGEPGISVSKEKKNRFNNSYFDANHIKLRCVLLYLQSVSFIYDKLITLSKADWDDLNIYIYRLDAGSSRIWNYESVLFHQSLSLRFERFSVLVRERTNWFSPEITARKYNNKKKIL